MTECSEGQGKRLIGAERFKFARLAVETLGTWKDKRAALIAAGWPEWATTEGRIKACLRDIAALEKRWGGGKHAGAPALGVREYTFGALTDEPGPDVRLPVFDGEPHLTGDWVVCGDLHLPTTDFALAERMLETARELDMRRLLIVGDLCNFEAFSKFEHLVPPPDFETEVRVAVRLITRFAEHFEEMVLVLGNHEHRLLRRSNGNLTATMLGHILSAAGGKLRVSPYSHAIIESGGQVWRATHQRNYSRIKGRLADQLAQKYQSNVLSFHQHHVAVQRDSWNRYTIIDAGGLHDDSKMAYVKLTDSNMPVMARGFVLLVSGVGHLFTPYPTLTNWPVLVAGLKAARGQK